jgi:hypothetical protein
MKAKLILWIKREIGWQNGIVLLLFFIILTYSFIRRLDRINNANYIEGISDGLHKGVKGSIHLYYHFAANKIEYKGDVPSTFCEKCFNNCCDSGKTVIVRYEKDDPNNNDLVTKNPYE